MVEVNVGKPRSPDQLSASPHATRYHTRPYRDPRRPRKTVKSPLRVSRRLGGSVLVGALSGHYQSLTTTTTTKTPPPRYDGDGDDDDDNDDDEDDNDDDDN